MSGLPTALVVLLRQTDERLDGGGGGGESMLVLFYIAWMDMATILLQRNGEGLWSSREVHPIPKCSKRGIVGRTVVRPPLAAVLSPQRTPPS